MPWEGMFPHSQAPLSFSLFKVMKNWEQRYTDRCNYTWIDCIWSRSGNRAAVSGMKKRSTRT